MKHESGIRACWLRCAIAIFCLLLVILSTSSQAQHSDAAASAKAARNRALFQAVEHGDKAKVKALLDQGADVNSRDKEGETALMRAVYGGRSEIARLLHSRGANVNATGPTGKTALMLAAEDWNSETVTLLLDSGADPNAKDKSGWTALMWDVSWREYDMVMGGRKEQNLAIERILKERGAQIDATDQEGMTALMHAFWWGHEDLAQGLLNLGADASIRDSKKRTAMTLNARYSRPITGDLVKHGAHIGVLDSILRKEEQGALNLLKEKADLSDRGPYGETALIAAAEMGSADVVRALLKQGADPNGLDAQGLSPLILALGGRPQHGSTGVSARRPALSGDPKAPQRQDIVRDLVQAGANVNARIPFQDRIDNQIITPLQWAIAVSPIEVIRILLTAGADVNLPVEGGITPLLATLERSREHFYALNHNYKPRPEVTQLLLDRGANVNAEDAKGETALMYCLDDLEMMRNLLHHGADLKHKNHRGQTVLAMTAELQTQTPEWDPKEVKGVAQTLKWLLAQGLNIHERDRYGWTLLTYAAINNDKHRVAQLKQQGLPVGIMDAVLLHDAAKVRALLARGEQPNQPEPDGRSLLVWAVIVDDKPIVEILLKHGADIRVKTEGGESALTTAEDEHRTGIKKILEKAGAE